jgi:hypothetical protein
VKQAQAAGEPAISVDTKEKELVGEFKNASREYRPKGQPEPVRVHDFLIPELGRAAPFGVYNIAATTTETGLKVQCEIDPNIYPAGLKVSDAEMDAVNIQRHESRGDRNYTINPLPNVRSDSS